MDKQQQRILLTAEGTYPHSHGGVSVWCDQLVRTLGTTSFDVLSIVDSPSRQPVFALPANVRSLIPVSTWGTEEAGEQTSRPFSETYRRKARASEADLEREFLPAYDAALREIFAGPDSDAAAFGRALARMRRYVMAGDYHSTMSSPRVWRVFLRHAHSQPHPLNLDEATTCQRWLTRFLGILTTPLPGDVDLVHSTMAGLAGLPGVLLKIERETPYILSEHGVYLREVYLSLSRSPLSDGCRRFLMHFYHAVARANYHHADVVTTLGRFNARWQERLGADRKRMVLTPNGVDPARFCPVAREENDRPTILTLARIYPLKGIDVLLEAAAIVRERVPNVRVRICGEVADTAYFARCEEIIRTHKLEDCVEFTQSKTPEKEYQQADIYCLPSVSEAMPFVIIEAMLTGCPVVATNVGNVADVLEGSGLLAPPNNPPALAARLVELLDGPEAAERRRELGERGLERARSRYTLDRAMANYQQLYEQVGQWKHVFQNA